MPHTRAHRPVIALPNWPAATRERTKAAVSRARNKCPDILFALVSSGIVMGGRRATRLRLAPTMAGLRATAG